MALTVTWSLEAIEDVESIASYIERDSTWYAKAVASTIVETAATIADFPEMGRVVPEISAMIAPIKSVSTRAWFGLAALVAAALLGFGFYLQYGQGLEPCPLCLVQRGFFFGVFGICVLGAIHGPRGWGVTVYGSLALLFALGGAGTAGRQVWLQHLPPDKVPQCGPDLYFMVENFPLARTIKTLFEGSGECAKVDWTFLGFSIAEWSLLWFVIFGLGAIILSVRGMLRTA